MLNVKDLYKNRFPQKDLKRKNEVWMEICKYLQRFISPTDVVVDVASGYGEFINNIIASKKIAVDINPETRSFLSQNIEFYESEATKLSSLLTCNVDVIFASNFLEHLPNKEAIDLFLDQVFQTLKPGGKFIILGPNIRYIPGKYWDNYDHYVPLSHISAYEALELKKFKIDLCIDRFLPQTIRSALPTHPLLVRAYLKIPFAWRFLGKQFLIIAKKQINS